MSIKNLLTACVIGLLATVALLADEALSPADKKAVDEANKYIERGNQFEQNGSLPRAKLEYEKALKKFPRHVDALYNLAIVCEKLGQNEEAVEHYKHYLEIRPNDADVWTQLGVRYDEDGKQTEAKAAYEKALAADPKFGLAHHNYGVMLEEEGKLDEAQTQLETFLHLEEAAGQRNGDAYYSLGNLFLTRHRVKEAKEMMQKALDTDPSISYYNNAMGDINLLENQTELAIAAYQKALERDSKYAPAYSGLGDAYKQMGDRTKAAAAYKKALDLRKDYVLVHYKLGLLYEDNTPAEAIKQFETYLVSGKNVEFQTEAKAKIEKLKHAIKQ